MGQNTLLASCRTTQPTDVFLIVQAGWTEEGVREVDSRLRCPGCCQQDRHHLDRFCNHVLPEHCLPSNCLIHITRQSNLIRALCPSQVKYKQFSVYSYKAGKGNIRILHNKQDNQSTVLETGRMQYCNASDNMNKYLGRSGLLGHEFAEACQLGVGVPETGRHLQRFLDPPRQLLSGVAGPLGRPPGVCEDDRTPVPFVADHSSDALVHRLQQSQTYDLITLCS